MRGDVVIAVDGDDPVDKEGDTMPRNTPEMRHAISRRRDDALGRGGGSSHDRRVGEAGLSELCTSGLRILQRPLVRHA